MLRSAVHKVMWLGRATVFLVGLSVILALVLGVGTAALGADGDLLRLGRANNASSATTLTKSGPGPALRLNVGSGPPLQVESGAKVARLNADRLDGKDSRALGVTIRTNAQRVATCTTPGMWKACAPMRVIVPPGRQYNVTVLSSFAAMASAQEIIQYCPAIQGGGYGLSCITPNVQSGVAASIDLTADDAESAASSGEITVGPGTYYFSTVLKPSIELYQSFEWSAHTTLLVTDVSAPGPPID